MDKGKSKNPKRILCDDNLKISNNKRFKEDIDMKNSFNSINLNEKCLKHLNATNDYILFPIDYLTILNSFISLDLVVNKLLSNREMPYVDRINNLLKQMNKSDLDEKVFGQILSIFPESYQYEFDKTPVKLTRHNLNRMQILPNLKFGSVNDLSPRKSSKSLSLSQLLLRQKTIRERLLMLVKEKHDKFLINIKKMKADDIEKMKIIRWASDFDLNDVGPIEAKCLDKNNRFSVDSSMLNAFTKKMTIEAEKSTICKDLFGNLTTKNNNEENKIPLKVEKSDNEPKIKKQPKELNQSQLSFSASETKSKKGGDFKKASKTVKSTENDWFVVQKQRLPFHLKALLELFINVDKTIHSLFMRGEMLYLSRVLKTVSVAKTFTESHFGQLLTVYPDAYKLRWEQVMNSQTNKLSSKLDIVVTPQLRNDCTQVSLSSPDKGFIKFDIVRLTQRHQRFLELCVGIVEKSRVVHSKIEGSDDFNVDLHVEMVVPTSLPARPTGPDSEKEVRIRSIADMFTIIKKRHQEETEKLPMKEILVSERLKSLPQSLLDRVRQNKQQRSLLSGVDNGSSQKRRMMLERVPRVAMAITGMLLREGGSHPVERSAVARAVCEDLGLGGVSAFEDHLALLTELCPGMVRTLHYSPPCLAMGTAVSRDEIVRRVQATLKGTVL